MNRKHKIGAGILVLSMFLPALALADTNKSTTTASSTKDSIRERLNEIKEKAREQAETLREEAKDKKGGHKNSQRHLIHPATIANRLDR